jgi:RHS repeat-associated protein
LTGNVVEKYSYTVYGQVETQSDHGAPLAAGRVGNRFMFTGREYDYETGLYHYRARIYNPGIGRFMQTAPVGYGDGMNWYLYCGNNPIGLVDPYGLCGVKGQYSSCFRGAGGDILQALYDGASLGGCGIFDLANTVTGGSLDQYQGQFDSRDALARNGLAGRISYGLGSVAGGAAAAAAALEVLGADLVLWGGTATAASNPQAVESVSVYLNTTAEGTVNYVGITNDMVRRAGEQASRGFTIEPIKGLDGNK